MDSKSVFLLEAPRKKMGQRVFRWYSGANEGILIISTGWASLEAVGWLEAWG